MSSDGGPARTPVVGAMEGFDALFAAERHGLVQLAVLLVDSRAQAEEIVQDAFAAVATRWDTLERPGAYLRTSVVNGLSASRPASQRKGHYRCCRRQPSTATRPTLIITVSGSRGTGGWR